MKEITQLKRQNLVQLFLERTTNLMDLSRITGYKPDTIKIILNDNGVKRKRPKHNYVKRQRNQKAKEILYELLTSDKKPIDIAKEYGVSRQYVSELCKKEIKKSAKNQI